MRYHGEVYADEHRYIVEGERGYVPLVTVKIDGTGFNSEFYLDPEQARELARHLVEASVTAERQCI
jgi:hypothetical protein